MLFYIGMVSLQALNLRNFKFEFQNDETKVFWMVKKFSYFFWSEKSWLRGDLRCKIFVTLAQTSDGWTDECCFFQQSYEDYQQISGRNGRNGVSSVDSGSYRETGGTNKNPSSMDGGMSVSGGNGNGSIGKVGKNGKSFVCDICMKTFSNAANMRRHRVRHSGVKPFECRFCQKRFFRKDHMREHMNHKHNNTQVRQTKN